ncbi:MAG TPA: hypothetical protein VIJ28_01935, partial [Chloroflexota bacterium]
MASASNGWLSARVTSPVTRSARAYRALGTLQGGSPQPRQEVQPYAQDHQPSPTESLDVPGRLC